MKRSKYSKIGKIINILYRNTKRLISLPFRLIRLPFKLILGPVFKSNLHNTHQHRIYINKRISGLAQQVDQNRTRYNLVMVHDSQLTQLEADFKRINNRINEVELSLESIKPIDLGAIKAEALGMQVAREEYDWHREQKAKDKQIQDRMRKDELTYDMHPAIADESID